MGEGRGASIAEFNKWETDSQTSARVDMEIDNNATWEDAFQFGTPGDITWDLNGATFEVDVQRNPYDEIPLLSLTSANARIIVDDPIQRVLHFRVAASDIQASLEPGSYFYDLVMI